MLSYYVLTKLKLFHYSPVIRDLVFDAISDGVLIYDEKFLLLEINSAGSVLLKNKHKALGFSIVEELLFWDKIKYLVSKNNKRFVINVSQDKTAETFYELFHEIIDTGNLYLHILIIHDITSRKRILETVEQKKRFDTLGLLAGEIAHDFNNLLMGISGNIELAILDLENAPKLTHEHLADALKSITDAKLLTRKILTFGKGDFIEKTNQNYVLFVEEIASKLTDSTNVFFEIQSFEDKIAIGIDATQIKQVLEYIIMNAIEAMNHKGELKIVIEQLRMSAENEFHLNEGDYIKTLIIDNGCGIEPRYLDYVFDAFLRQNELHGFRFNYCALNHRKT